MCYFWQQKDDTQSTQTDIRRSAAADSGAAYAGHKVHIYKEDPAHFAALCGDLLPDNGAHQIVVERCIVDDFYFFPYLDAVQPAHSFYCGMLAVLMPEATQCRRCMPVPGVSLRAPPAA